MAKSTRSRNSRSLETRENTTRVPVGDWKSKLDVAGKDPNFVYRWVDDNKGNMWEFENGGYEVVKSEEVNASPNLVHDFPDKGGSVICRPNGGSDGGHLYLMKIKKEWYDEDQQAKEDRRLKTERTMSRKRNVHDRSYDIDASGDDGYYGQIEFGTPSSGIRPRAQD